MNPTVTRFEYKKLAYDSIQRWVREDGEKRPSRPGEHEAGRYEREFWARTQELGREGWELIRSDYAREGGREGLFLFRRALAPVPAQGDTQSPEPERRVIGQEGDVRTPYADSAVTTRNPNSSAG